MSDSYYDVAQICENGHVVNSSAREFPTSNSPFCATCGAKTIMACPSCAAPIRGYYHVPDVISFDHYTAPAFCHQCGTPFPWTDAALAAASELAGVLEGLSEQEREELKKTLGDLVRETPRTRVAETKFKSIMRKARKDGYDAMKSVLTDVLSETVKKTLFGA